MKTRIFYSFKYLIFFVCWFYIVLLILYQFHTYRCYICIISVVFYEILNMLKIQEFFITLCPFAIEKEKRTT